MPGITISRQFGSLDEELALLLASKLAYNFFELEELIDRLMSDLFNKEEQELLIREPKRFHNNYINGQSIFSIFESRLHNFAKQENLVLLGFGSCNFLSSEANFLHIRIIAQKSIREKRICKKYGLSYEESKKWLELSDRRFQRLISILHKSDINDLKNYDIVLSSDKLNAETLTEIVYESWQQFNLQNSLSSDNNVNIITNPDDSPILKNPSEIEFARVLDRYHLDWRYEPKTYPIEWDKDGKVTLAFSPDFYLPRFNLYLELTTMKQKYINIKRQKLKKLKELYPDVNVRIVYKKDFEEIIKHLIFDLDKITSDADDIDE